MKIWCLLTVTSLSLFYLVSLGQEKAARLRIEGNNYIIENQHYKVILDKAKGGLISRLDFQGATIIDWSNIYTDYGIYEPREYVGTTNETAPQINYQYIEATIQVTSQGFLKKKAEEPPEYPRIEYRITYNFDSSPNIAISCGVKPGFDKQEVLGFLAHPMTLSDISEWFVHTIDGLICETISAGNQRTYQSAIDPMDGERPFFGFVTENGTFILFSDIKIKAPTPMQNIFFHEAGNGRITLFFAWLDGILPVKLMKNRWYEVSYILKISPEIESCPAEAGGGEEFL